MRGWRTTRALRTLLVSILLAVVALPAAGAAELDINGYFDDDNSSVHEQDIDSIAAAGITLGCNPPANTNFCPAQDVTRGEMAAFLRRAKGLPFVTTDYFWDDNGSTFEDDINAIAADGITQGCGGGRYCGSVPMRRSEMAAMLANALRLPQSSTDHFVDDNGNPLEEAINSIADAGVTLGCNPPDNDRFCPDLTVSRAQMASFLTRAFDLPAVYIEGPLEFALPFSGVCDSQQTSCSATITLPSIDAYLINEGWFYKPPFAPGEQALFEAGTTDFRARLDGIAIDLDSAPTESEGGSFVRRFTGTIPRLSKGSHEVTGEWRWDGTVVYETRLTLIID